MQQQQQQQQRPVYPPPPLSSAQGPRVLSPLEKRVDAALATVSLLRPSLDSDAQNSHVHVTSAPQLGSQQQRRQQHKQPAPLLVPGAATTSTSAALKTNQTRYIADVFAPWPVPDDADESLPVPEGAQPPKAGSMAAAAFIAHFDTAGGQRAFVRWFLQPQQEAAAIDALWLVLVEAGAQVVDERFTAAIWARFAARLARLTLVIGKKPGMVSYPRLLPGALAEAASLMLADAFPRAPHHGPIGVTAVARVRRLLASMMGVLPRAALAPISIRGGAFVIPPAVEDVATSRLVAAYPEAMWPPPFAHVPNEEENEEDGDADAEDDDANSTTLYAPRTQSVASTSMSAVATPTKSAAATPTATSTAPQPSENVVNLVSFEDEWDGGEGSSGIAVDDAPYEEATADATVDNSADAEDSAQLGKMRGARPRPSRRPAHAPEFAFATTQSSRLVEQHIISTLGKIEGMKHRQAHAPHTRLVDANAMPVDEREEDSYASFAAKPNAAVIRVREGYAQVRRVMGQEVTSNRFFHAVASEELAGYKEVAMRRGTGNARKLSNHLSGWEAEEPRAWHDEPLEASTSTSASTVPSSTTSNFQDKRRRVPMHFPAAMQTKSTTASRALARARRAADAPDADDTVRAPPPRFRKPPNDSRDVLAHVVIAGGVEQAGKAVRPTLFLKPMWRLSNPTEDKRVLHIFEGDYHL